MKKIFALAFAAFACLANGAVKVGYEVHDDIGGDVPVVIDAWGAVSNDVNAVVADKAWLTVSNDVMTAIRKKSWGAVYHSMTNWVTQELNAKITETNAWAAVEDNVYLAISERAWSAVSQNIIATLQTMFDEQFGDREGVSKEYVNAMISVTYANMFNNLWMSFYGYKYAYYVDAVNGNDKNRGDVPQLPFKTLDKALDALAEKHSADGFEETDGWNKVAVMAGDYDYPHQINYNFADFPVEMYALQGKDKARIFSDEMTKTNGLHGMDFEVHDSVKYSYFRGFTIEGFNRRGCKSNRGHGKGTLYLCEFEDCRFITDNRNGDITRGFSYNNPPFANCALIDCEVVDGHYYCDTRDGNNGGMTLFFGCDLYNTIVKNNHYYNSSTSSDKDRSLMQVFHTCYVENCVYIDGESSFRRIDYYFGTQPNIRKSIIAVKNFSSNPFLLSDIYDSIIGTDNYNSVKPTTGYVENTKFCSYEDALEFYENGMDDSSFYGYVEDIQVKTKKYIESNFQTKDALVAGSFLIYPKNDKLLMFTIPPPVAVPRSRMTSTLFENVETKFRNYENRKFYEPILFTVIPRKCEESEENE